MTDPVLHAVVVRVLGVAVAIPAHDALAASRLRHQWARALTTAPAEVVADASGLVGMEPEQHDYTMTSRVTLRALEATAGTRLNVHAGAVADSAGRALAVVGESGMGKTTAINALARRLGYLSDETVSVSPDLTVHPHAKPLSVITDRSRPDNKASVSPDDAGLLIAPEHATLRRIVLLRRGQGNAGLVPLTTPQAMVEIVPQTSSLVLLGHPLLTLGEIIEGCGGAFALHYEEVDDHLDNLIHLLSEPDRARCPVIHHPPVDPPPADPGQWSRHPWLDAVQYDDELVVMVGDTAHLLAGLGSTIWLALAAPMTDAGLVAVAEAEHGPHPDAGALIEAALAELHGHGLVTQAG
ncbi:MAG: hypothetical protein JWN68_2674 [Nocardioides sp.]|uniref:hypothetical protein n=1 Tax=Nocardioides sp. TaxID=35761 RepID=UPI0026246CFD|nr:hypothetical protein [Nocardioides sp.]MCW2834721.1 hypothetical protein [Nocardioides sp.]